jgi:hypothetical protein
MDQIDRVFIGVLFLIVLVSVAMVGITVGRIELTLKTRHTITKRGNIIYGDKESIEWISAVAAGKMNAVEEVSK